jgi:hypothetical protein
MSYARRIASMTARTLICWALGLAALVAVIDIAGVARADQPPGRWVYVPIPFTNYGFWEWFTFPKDGVHVKTKRAIAASDG